ncbi:MAG: histidine kinase, partial [Odoribacter sp.]|nr:histidine kinase [Odoribacter sp.]
SLQVLIENALKHNLASEEKPLEISICNKNDSIIIYNNLQRKNAINKSLGTGLSNLRERVKLITGKEMTINEENNQFTVILPLINI